MSDSKDAQSDSPDSSLHDSALALPPIIYPNIVGSLVVVANPDGSQSGGKIKYAGPIKEGGEIWLGIEWADEERGKHNGELNGVRYFTTKGSKNSGSFIKPPRVAFTSFLHALEKKYRPAINGAGTSDNSALSLSAHNEDTARSFSVAIDFVGRSRMLAELAQRFQEAKLTSVSLQNMNIYTIQKMEMKFLASLHELDLAFNCFYDVNEILAFIEAAGVYRGLTTLNIAFNPFKHELFPKAPLSPPLQHFFSNARVLVLNGLSPACLSAFLAIPALALPALEELHCAHMELKRLPEADYKALLPSLRLIDLSHNLIDDFDVVTPLAGLATLEKLILSDNQIPNIVINQPSTNPSTSSSSTPVFPSLTALSLAGNCLTSFDALSCLNFLPKLVDLRVQRNPPLEALVTRSVSLLRFRVISTLLGLVRLNGSAITAKERTDGEKYFLQEIAAQCASGAIRDVGEIEKKYKRAREIADRLKTPLESFQFAEAAPTTGEEKSGAKAHDTAQAGGADLLGQRLIAVNFLLMALDGSTKVQSKKVLPSLSVSACRALGDRLFKIAQDDRSLYELRLCSSKPDDEQQAGAGEAMEEAFKELSAYGVASGNWIVWKKIAS